MKSQKKQIAKTIVYLIVLATVVGAGIVAGVFESVEEAFGGLNLNATSILRVAIMVFLVLAVQNFIIMILNACKFKHNRSNTMRTILTSLVRYAGAIIIICWGLRLLGVDVATIVASVGIIALIVGFGAESLIEDVITGFFMLFENQYNVGDIVEIGGFRGTVTNIGIRTTAITDMGGNIKIVNNSNMKDILNRSDNASRSVAEIGVPYSIDLEKFEETIPEILEKIYNNHQDKMKDKPVYVGVSELAPSAVMLKFYVEVHEADIYSVQRILNRDLFVEFKKAGVEVPFMQVDVHNH